MSQQLQELISKIKSEGVQAAQSEGKAIEAQARTRAQQIIDEAKKKADQIVAQAGEESKKLRESTEKALQQSSRDMLLNLRKEIETALKGLMAVSVKEALTPERLADIIESVIKNFISHKSSDVKVEVTVSHQDLKALQAGFIKKLQDHLKHPIKFHSAEDIGKGFTVSFDGGKSSFDFSDASLVEYLSASVNADVAAIMKKSVSS